MVNRDPKTNRNNIKICPRCKGNGYFKVKESAERLVDQVVQCPMCNSQGEIDEDKASSIYVDADGLHRMH